MLLLLTLLLLLLLLLPLLQPLLLLLLLLLLPRERLCRRAVWAPGGTQPSAAHACRVQFAMSAARRGSPCSCSSARNMPQHRWFSESCCKRSDHGSTHTRAHTITSCKFASKAHASHFNIHPPLFFSVQCSITDSCKVTRHSQ